MSSSPDRSQIGAPSLPVPTPLNVPAYDAQRIPLPGSMRDPSRYVLACAVAGAFTLAVPVFTRRTHLPLSVPEPDMIYAKRISSRAFLYATCINVYVGIGLTAAACYYCEIDNVRLSCLA
jgi:hypothetical protein